VTPADQAAPPDPRGEIDAALDAGEGDAGALGEARELARAYWRGAPNALTARFLLTRVERLWGDQLADHRVAVLRSFTVEPVMPLLEAEAALWGRRLVPWIGEFNAYGQEILDPSSGLYAHRPDTVILAVQTRDVAPELWSGFTGLSDDAVDEVVAAVAARLGDLVAQLRARTSANILVHGLAPPPTPAEGLLGARRKTTQAEAVAAVNRALRARFSDMASVHLLDMDELQARHGRARFHSEKKWVTTKLPFTIEGMSWMAQAWWRWLAVFALPQAKVLALDLDNTLWGGVVGEDGLAGLKLGDEHPGAYFKDLQRVVLDIARRGVLLVLVSKNNLDDAMKVFDEHPEMLLKREHLAAMRVNWAPKPANLAALADELNLGLESFVFLDDNPVERAAVRRALPQVIVPEIGADPSTYAEVLRGIPQLERLSLSAEDAGRTRMYAQERERRDLEAAAGSLEDFLASLDIRVEIAPIDAMSLARASQLTVKTNQLNMTTRRYNEAQLAERLADPAWAGFVLRASDRFGDNGVVGVALLQGDGDTCRIDSFLMSCRVIGRGIETAFLARLAHEARGRGQAKLQGWFLPSPKNAPARDIYRQAGLRLVEAGEAGDLWGLDLADEDIAVPSWIALAPAKAVR
jgi:FkbH-like protein